MYKCIEIMKRQLNYHRIPTFIIMTGLIISMTLISFSASAMEKSINNVKKDLNYLPASGIEVDVKLEKKSIKKH
ncbi:MAG: hypothetical protein N4A40_09435 [Tissierellales bacterium]|nr:hypothetical protein [Tissierellales bacterium]